MPFHSARDPYRELVPWSGFKPSGPRCGCRVNSCLVVRGFKDTFGWTELHLGGSRAGVFDAAVVA